jgi:hypothetical protein
MTKKAHNLPQCDDTISSNSHGLNCHLRDDAITIVAFITLISELFLVAQVRVVVLASLVILGLFEH